MKRSLFLLLAAALMAACKSQHYALQYVQPHRIEVTRALDAQPVKAAEDFIAPFRSGVDSLQKPYIGQSEIFMTGARPESTLSNWMADALVAIGQHMGYSPDMGIYNIGGLRAAMPKDTVRRGDIIGISPFENFFSVLQLRGSDVLSLMQDIAAVHGEGVSHSVRLVITRDGRLKSATIAGREIQQDSIYTIATINYLADGNDHLTSLRNSVTRTDTQITIRDALMDYLQRLDSEGKKATARIEGRIIETDEGEAPPLTRQKEVGGPEQRINIRETTTDSRDSRSLLIVHTNDTHSCIDPLSPLLSDTAHADKGGYLRRAALLRDMRQQEPDLLLLDAGDFSQGSAYYSLYHGDVEVELMNLMHYDAATIGNHEFDFGLENLARLFRRANFPIVCCNYDFTGTPVEGLVKPYVILHRAGLKIGILGVAPQLEGLVAAHTCPGVVYTDPIQAAQPIADYLKDSERCDLVICLSHLGWQMAGIGDEEFIPATHNIDIVIGGHSHTYFASPQLLTNSRGITVPDNQMGKNARYVGTLRLNFIKEK